MTNTIIINRRNPAMWVIVGLVIIALVLLWNGCRITRNKGAQLTIEQRNNDSLSKLLTQVRRENDTAGQYYGRKAHDAEMRRVEALDMVQRKDSALRVSQSTAARLARRVLSYERPDTSGEDGFIVPKAYVQECDSLGNIVLVQDVQITRLREEVIKTGDLMTHEIDLRQQEINRRKNVTDSLIGIAVGLQHSNNNLLKMARPTWKIYLAGSAGWTPQGVQAAAGFSYADKKSTMVTVQAVWQNGYGGMITLHKLLSLRKK